MSRETTWTIELEFGNVDFTPFAFFKVTAEGDSAEEAIDAALTRVPAPIRDQVPDRVEAKKEPSF